MGKTSSGISNLFPPVEINLRLGHCGRLYIDCGLDSVQCKTLVTRSTVSLVCRGLLPEMDTTWFTLPLLPGNKP